MLIVSMGQLYGDVLYFATCFLEGAFEGSISQIWKRDMHARRSSVAAASGPGLVNVSSIPHDTISILRTRR